MANTTADKLTYLEETKAAIKDAIVSKSVTIPDGTTFRQYAGKIGEIPSIRTANIRVLKYSASEILVNYFKNGEEMILNVTETTDFKADIGSVIMASAEGNITFNGELESIQNSSYENLCIVLGDGSISAYMG